MTNGQIYKKTLTFSVSRFFVDLLSLLIFIGAPVAGFFLMENVADIGLVGLVIGLVVGIIILAIITRFVAYRYSAAQIGMMMRGITENELPENVREEGLRMVKERFATVAIYFGVTSAIKGVFNQIGRMITGAAGAIGGEKGEAVGSVISAVIQTIVAYLCDCCLGWIFYRKGVNAFKAACEGAVLFFRHGKTFAKNMGRVFGIGVVSFLCIGGVFAALFYGIFSGFPDVFLTISGEIAEMQLDTSELVYDLLTNASSLMVVAAIVVAAIFWGILHSVLVRPFVLVGVLRNYLMSGIGDTPTESAFSELAQKSSKFAELQKKAMA